MTQEANLNELAIQYHEALPERIRAYLNERGIPDAVIDLHLLGWNGRRITIPIPTYTGEIAFFKLAKDPASKSSGPKMMATKGASAELYGWEEIKRQPEYVIICEGEFDRMVLEVQGFVAVTSTGGAGSFKEGWTQYFSNIPYVYICYDRDEAGHKGAIKGGRMIPHAKLIQLPPEVGEGGDVTDFFVRLGRSRDEFLQLMQQAEPAPPLPEPIIQEGRSGVRPYNSSLQRRIERIKRNISITEIVERYIKLRVMGEYRMGRCPFHTDTNPSLAVYPKTGTFYCYGCQKHGDVIDFVKAHEQLTFRQALDLLDSLRTYYGRKSLGE